MTQQQAKLTAGRLRDRVEVQCRTMLPGPGGERAPAWSTYATVWANVEDLGASEGQQAQQQRGTRTGKVTLRRLPQLAPTHRFLFKGRELNIVGVIDPDGRGEWMEASWSEKVAS